MLHAHLLYLLIVVVWEVPSVGHLGIGDLCRAVAIVIVITTDNVPLCLQRACSEHILTGINKSSLTNSDRTVKTLVPLFYKPSVQVSNLLYKHTVHANVRQRTCVRLIRLWPLITSQSTLHAQKDYTIIIKWTQLQVCQ